MQQYKKFLTNYYISGFLYDFVFAYAIYSVLFHIKGLSIPQISVLLAVWSFAAIIFEIPSGALADSSSRKKMLTYAPLIKSLCFVVWFFAGGNFYMYLLGFVLWSLASSLVSGTTQALLFDTLKHFDKSDDYEKAIGRKNFFTNISLAFSFLLGGALAYFSLELPVILSVLPLVASAYFAAKMLEVPKIKSTEETKYFSYIKTAFNEFRKSRALIYLMIYTLVLAGIFGNLEEFDQLYYQLVHLPIVYFGVVGFIWSIAIALTSDNAHKLKKYPVIYYLPSIISGIFLILVAKLPSIPMIILLVAAHAIVAPLRVLTESKIQREIKSISRATVTSIIAFLEQGFGGLLLLLFGLVSRIWNLQAIYLFAAIILLIFSAWSVSVKKLWKS